MSQINSADYSNRKNYHPLIILLYHSNMLSSQELEQIPKRTKQHWNHFEHEFYDHTEMAQPFIDKFNHIKEVVNSKHLYQAMKFACSMRRGYQQILKSIEHNKKLMRQHAKTLTDSVQYVAKLNQLKISEAARIMGVGKDWFYRHRKKNKCKSSLISKCFRQYPNQLTLDEQFAIQQLVSHPEHSFKPKTTLYYHAMREEVVFCGKTTFFKYASEFGHKTVKPEKAGKNKPGLKAYRLFEWLHVDVMEVPIKHGLVQKVAFVKDNFSKAILHYKNTSGSINSGFIRDLLKETFDKHGLLDLRNPINILSDGGSENKGLVVDWIEGISAPTVVRKITAKTPECRFSNSMSESTHSIYKTEFMRKRLSLNLEAHLKSLMDFVDYYNHHRYPTVLKGLTPNEMLNGQLPNRDCFKERIQSARKERVKKNQKFDACPLVCTLGERAS